MPNIPAQSELQRKCTRVSLITACYNSEATIGRTLQSILSQRGGYELEHVLQDGGSSDGTLRLIERYVGGRGRELEVGSRQLEVDSGKLEVGSRQLEVGSRQLEVGSRQLEVDSGKLAVGRGQLEEGVEELEVDSRQLAEGGGQLAEGSWPDLRVSLKSESDAGFYDAINKGIARATGDIVGLINADDWLTDENVLADVVKCFEGDPTVDAVYGDLDYVSVADSDGLTVGNSRLAVGSWQLAVETGTKDQEQGTKDFFPHEVKRHWVSGSYTQSSLKNGWMPPHPTIYVRREVFEKYGSYRIDMGSAADYEWIVRVFAKERVKAAYLPRVTVKMLVGGQSNASIGARLRANRMDRRAWTVNGLKPYPWFAIAKPLRKWNQFLGKWSVKHSEE